MSTHPERDLAPINPDRVRTLVTRRLALNVVEWGAIDARPLLLIHGGLDQCRSWDWTAWELAGRWRIIAPDLRGHGDSAWSSDGHYSLQAHMFDIADIIEQLGIARLPIIGHSMGGAIALRYAGIFPEKVDALVAIEGVGLPPSGDRRNLPSTSASRLRKWIDDTRDAERRGNYAMRTLEEAAGLMRSMNRSLSVDRASYLARHATRRDDEGHLRWKFDHLARVRFPIELGNDEVQALWSQIDCPVLLINGSDSWAGNPACDGRVRYFKNARSVEFDGAGHWVHHDRFTSFIGTISEFLASLPAASGLTRTGIAGGVDL